MPRATALRRRRRARSRRPRPRRSPRPRRRRSPRPRRRPRRRRLRRPERTAPRPGALIVSSAGQTSVTVSWQAAIDNVGRRRLPASRAGAAPLAVGGLSTTIAGLACGTSVTVPSSRSTRQATPRLRPPPPGRPPRVRSSRRTTTSRRAGATPRRAPRRRRATPRARLRRLDRGQTISVAPGSYPEQTIPNDRARDTSVHRERRVDRRDRRRRSHVTLQDFNTGGWKAAEGTTDITFRT